jgi:hypothetical protein
MKKLFVIAAMMVAAVAANAQITLKPMAGLTIATITDMEDNSFRPGLAAGAEAEYLVNDMFGVSGGLLVSMQGTNYDDYSVTVNGVTNGWKDYSSTLTYLNIPLLANVHVAKGFAIKAGVQPGILLSAKTKQTEIVNNAENDWDRSSTDGLKKLDISIPLGVSYEISDFVIDARYNLGLTKINENGSNSSKNSVIMVTLGYKFAL